MEYCAPETDSEQVARAKDEKHSGKRVKRLEVARAEPDGSSSSWGAGSAMSKRGNSRARAPRAGVARRKVRSGSRAGSTRGIEAVLWLGGGAVCTAGSRLCSTAGLRRSTMAITARCPAAITPRRPVPARAAGWAKGMSAGGPLRSRALWVFTAPQLSEHARAAPAQAAEASLMNGRERVGR